jgi:toxin secretion/phage lysis holin
MKLDMHYSLKLFALQDGDGALKVIGAMIGAAFGYVFNEPAENSSAIGVGVLLVFDLVTGVMAAIKQKKAVTSIAFSRTLNKVFGYLAILAVAGVVERTILESVRAPIMVGVLWMMIAREGLSIIENTRKCGLTGFGFLENILDGVKEHGKHGNPATKPDLFDDGK